MNLLYSCISPDVAATRSVLSLHSSIVLTSHLPAEYTALTDKQRGHARHEQRTILCKAVTRGGVLGVKTPPKLFAIFLVSQLCLFVQQNIFRLRLLKIDVCLNYLQCQFMLDLIYITSTERLFLLSENTISADFDQFTCTCIWLVTACGITRNGKKIPNRNPCRHAQKLIILK